MLGDDYDDFRTRSYSSGRLSLRARHARARFLFKARSLTKSAERRENTPASPKRQVTRSNIHTLTDQNYGKTLAECQEEDPDCGCLHLMFNNETRTLPQHTDSTVIQPTSTPLTSKDNMDEGISSTTSSLTEVAELPGKRRVLAHMHHVVQEEDWVMGEMRPRVASMPVRPSRNINHSRDLARSQVETYMRRKFSITKRGLVKEGDQLVSRSSVQSINSEKSPSSAESQSLKDSLPRHRVMMLGLQGVGKKALLQEWGADLSVHMQTKGGKLSEATTTIPQR